MTVSPLNLDFIAGFQRGSYESVKELYEQFYADLAVLAEKAIQHTAIAHDIVLETYVKLYRMRMQFDNIANIKAFLYVTVRNTCQRHHSAAHPVVEGGSTPWYADAADHAGRFNDEAVRARAVEQLCGEVEQLPEKCRRVFQLVFCKRLSMAELAEQLDMDQPTVVQQRNKAIQQLRDNVHRKKLFSVPLFVYFLAVACGENC